ncbi:MAG: adenosyl-hopene transferase HpnH [Acidobacteria bacterium]|nr:adenosyl-hopene transferase HpnH [Acidobacteriota bacterium]
MPFPLRMTATMTSYLLKKRLQGREKFPLVMMLEPLHACNLTCTGCGRIREYEATIREKLTVEQCLRAVEDCGAPIISICGGEPMIYPPLGELVAELLKRKKYIYLCTNGMFIQKRLQEFQPSPRFFFNVHLDGLEETHDLCVERKGVFRAAIEGIKTAKAAGFLVCTNTTIYKETDMGEVEAMLDYLQTLGCDGHMLSPAYSYSAVQVKEIFMDRAVIREKFRDIDRLFRKFKLNSSPVYVEFLKGTRELTCTAWGNPTYNTKGWKGPCYLMTDAHHPTFQQFLNRTPWEKYGYGKDPRCENCMVHCGYEPSAALGVNRKLGDTLKMMAWALRS